MFKHRDIIRSKRAWGGSYLVRNENLIASGPLGPTGFTGPIATNSKFKYQTPLVRFIDPLVPSLVNQQPIDISSPTGATALSAHLSKMFGDILGPESLSSSNFVGVLFEYGYPLAQSGAAQTDETEELIATTPIGFAPFTEIINGNTAPLVAQLNSSLQQWKNNGGPTGNVGDLIFQVSVFAAQAATGPMGATAAPIYKPILRLTDLRLPMDRIIWGPEGLSEEV
jgi:hypothetical protein